MPEIVSLIFDLLYVLPLLPNVPNPCYIFISLGLFCYCLINKFTLNSYSPHRILCFLLVWVYTWKRFCGSLFRRGFFPDYWLSTQEIFTNVDIQAKYTLLGLIA